MKSIKEKQCISLIQFKRYCKDNSNETWQEVSIQLKKSKYLRGKYFKYSVLEQEKGKRDRRKMTRDSKKNNYRKSRKRNKSRHKKILRCTVEVHDHFLFSVLLGRGDSGLQAAFLANDSMKSLMRPNTKIFLMFK